MPHEGNLVRQISPEERLDVLSRFLHSAMLSVETDVRRGEPQVPDEYPAILDRKRVAPVGIRQRVATPLVY